MSLLREAFTRSAGSGPPPGGGSAGGGGGLWVDGPDPASPIASAPTRVATAVNIIGFLAHRLGALPRSVVERGDKIGRPIEDRTREFAFLWDAPNPAEDAVPWWTRMWAHLEGHANAFLFRRRFGARTVGLDLLHPARVRVVVDGDDRTYRYRPPGGGAPVDYRRDDIVHVMRLSWDGIRGVPPLTAAAAPHRIAAMQDRWQMSHYRRGGRPSGVVSSPAEHDAMSVAEFYDGWEDQVGSASGMGVLLLQGGAEYTPVLAASDEGLLQARVYTREEILGSYAPGIPHHQLGWRSNTSNFGTGIEHQNLHLLSHVFEPRFGLVSDVLSRHLLSPELMLHWPTGQWIKSDAKSTAEVYSKMRAGGAASRDEWRSAAGLAPAGAADDFWQPRNMDSVPAGAGR